MGNSQQDRLDVAKQIVELFRWERFSYLGVSLLSALIVVFVGFQAAKKGNTTIADFTALFGSGGLIAYNINRLIIMFNKVLYEVFKSDNDAVRGQ